MLRRDGGCYGYSVKTFYFLLVSEEEEEDDLEEAITDTTRSVQYDHPNHTVTVTTISNLDLTDAKLLGLGDDEVGVQDVRRGDAGGLSSL